MTPTIIVGFISIIPGLGFWLFRRYRQALFIFVLVVGLLLFSVFSPWEGLNELLFIMALYFWYMQISMAVRMAQAIKFSNNELTLALIENVEGIQIPTDLSRKEKMVFRIRETLGQQLEFGEKFVEGIHAMRGMYGGQYYLGISDKNLIIIEIDFFSKPLYVKRFVLSDVEKIQHKRGIINDSLVFSLKNSKPMKFDIPYTYKDKIFLIVRELEKFI